MNNRRTFLKQALIGSAGVMLLGQGSNAFAEPVREITIHNDYSVSIAVDLFHPIALDQVFATWQLTAGQKGTLRYDGQPIHIMSDWGIRVRFPSGAQSAVMRVAEIDVGGTEIKASHIYDLPFANYRDSGVKITRIDGYDIASDFGRTETEILTSALAIFYERFLRTHAMGCPELCTRSASRHILNSSDFDDNLDTRDYIEAQRWRFLANETNGFAFPHVELEYAYTDDDWLARAEVGIVKTRPRESGEFGSPFPIEGSFKIEVNDFFVNNSNEYSHYSNPAYWAGVIAHEALHNLGHRHPPSRSDSQYYLHQMIIVEHLVMVGDKVRYGESNPTPVLCQKRP